MNAPALTLPDPDSRAKAKTLRPLVRLAGFVSEHKLMMSAALVALTLAAVATLALPLALRDIIDVGFDNATRAEIGQILIFCFILSMVLALASAGRFYCVTWLGERIAADLRARVYRHVLRLTPAFFEAQRTSEIVARLLVDTTLVRTTMGSSASVALRNVLLLIGSSVMLVWTSPRLSALVLIVIPLAGIPLLLFGRLVRRLSRRAQDHLADAGTLASETLGAIHTVQAFTREDFERARFAHAVETAFGSARRRISARSVLVAILFLIVFGSVVAVFGQGTALVFEGALTGGELGQFILYAVFAAAAMAALGEVWSEMQLAAGATERLFELLDTAPSIEKPANPTPLASPVKGRIAFEDVSFVYPTRANVPAVSHLSFTIVPGETVALAGVSGAGKSTIFRLLHRFEDPQKGRITLDGVPLSALDPQALRHEMASVFQDVALFDMSVADNIRYARPDASQDDVEQAARAACAHTFIEALPQGFETIIGERGQTLSGGERQRIAIARALLRAAPILLLDEATSALDSENETAIQNALDAATGTRTTLVIAHRLSTIERAHRILLLEKGQIVAEGTHAELLKTSALYRRLAKTQFARVDSPPARKIA